MARESTKPTLRLEWRDPSELTENPANWRKHPQQQMDTLGDAINEVGWAGACLYNEATGHLIDGHARRDMGVRNGTKVPVLIGSWTPEQERKILATLDPIGDMAVVDPTALNELLSGMGSDGDGMSGLLDSLSMDATDLEFQDISNPETTGGGEPQEPNLGQHRLKIRPVLSVTEVATFERAIQKTGLTNRGEAIMAICEAYLAKS